MTLVLQIVKCMIWEDLESTLFLHGQQEKVMNGINMEVLIMLEKVNGNHMRISV